MKTKTIWNIPGPTSPPVNVAVPNIIPEKMRAIEAIAAANLELAKALNTVLLDVTLSNNTIVTPEKGTVVNVSGEGL